MATGMPLILTQEERSYINQKLREDKGLAGLQAQLKKAYDYAELVGYRQDKNGYCEPIYSEQTNKEVAYWKTQIDNHISGIISYYTKLFAPTLNR